MCQLQTDRDCGFPRQRRLLAAGDYSRVFSNNVRVTNRHWTILAGAGQGVQARLGLAIAKKRAKRAVDRNRLKRVVRESFRLRCKSLGRIDIVVMNRDACVAASNAELRASLDGLWNKLVLKCKSSS
ncbi:MAG: ribonuclease P protein component [Gammaproteobacteria bacterium]|nr:ribonuclease P protein component [Gammaproteobacteria bacterium]